MGEPLLELRGETAGYRGKPVLRDLDLTVNAGDRVALLGRSGAGKSTLLGLIHERLRAQASLVPQAAALVRTLSVFHNVYMGRLDRRSTLHNLRTLIRPARADAEEVRATLRLVDMGGAFLRAGRSALGRPAAARLGGARAL
nr:ATP-binding cassette domain-containing protein [Chenggangzhangella methanolivorans]